MATAIIGTLKHLPKASILPTLPETGRPNRIYFIPNEDPTEDNRYNEYLWVKDETYPDGHWELVGPTTIDLTDYATKEEVSDLKEGGSRGELSTKSLAKMSESLKRGYSEFPERREKIRNKALGRKMPKDTRCKISLNHSKSNLLKINDEVGSIRYWALKIGKAHSVLSYRLKVHGIDNLRKYIEQRIKLV